MLYIRYSILYDNSKIYKTKKNVRKHWKIKFLSSHERRHGSLKNVINRDEKNESFSEQPSLLSVFIPRP